MILNVLFIHLAIEIVWRQSKINYRHININLLIGYSKGEGNNLITKCWCYRRFYLNRSFAFKSTI